MTIQSKIDIPFDILLLIVFDDSFSAFKYSSLSGGFTFIRTGDNPLWVAILCTVMKKRQRVPQTCSCNNLL